jgi:anti-sigma regulatory factor (Ser/Thr protein kinase)
MMEFNFKIESGDFTNAGSISSSVKRALKQLNVDGSVIKRTVVALYESEVNVVAHSHGGEVVVNIFDDCIKINITDSGPGIPDIEKAMTQGFSTASPEVREMGFGAGMGLPNIKNNTDDFDLKSEMGVGTVLKFVNYFKA